MVHTLIAWVIAAMLFTACVITARYLRVCKPTTTDAPLDQSGNRPMIPSTGHPKHGPASAVNSHEF